MCIQQKAYVKQILLPACLRERDGTASTLHVSDGLSVHHQELKNVHTAKGIGTEGKVLQK